ncbi:hypothetical protein IIO_05222 [Bacillus cereus VD115]|nr:hypothetical protein IIO_05222 [Bacillus cereus VD115]
MDFKNVCLFEKEMKNLYAQRVIVKDKSKPMIYFYTYLGGTTEKLYDELLLLNFLNTYKYRL